jgi:hypothetical protein
MSPTELKVQRTIHLEGKARYLPCPYPALRFKYIVGCIFNSIGLIITRESPCTNRRMTSTKFVRNYLLNNLQILLNFY